MQLNSTVENLQFSLIRVLKNEAAKYNDAIDLTIGEPDLPTPTQIIEETMKYGLNNQLKYALSGGGEYIGKLIAQYYNANYNSNYSEKNIIMTVGASEALSSTLKTILNPEDEVILFSPAYPGYAPMIKLAYGIPKFIDISKSNFKISKEQLEKVLTKKTKAILLSNPCNPTGNILSYEEMLDIAEFVNENNIFLISDEIYSALSFYKFHSFAEFERIKDKTIIINGFSKSHSMTGWRIGYIICPEKYRQFFLNTSFYTLSSVMSLSLKAAEIALKKHSDRSEFVNIYKERAEYLSQELTKLGYKVVQPKGAFYIFANYSNISSLPSLDFALDLLQKTKIAVVPGISFGTEGYIRIALTVDLDKLKKAVARLATYPQNFN